ncbi:hypothetical protein [Microbispora corallina]|uniref:hypothetical protein n=1 Tax=Microbispora corallina TaxID=83302 RepID=UPI001EF1C753|nr:hypothetical protein [Microbispora corallina]
MFPVTSRHRPEAALTKDDDDAADAGAAHAGAVTSAAAITASDAFLRTREGERNDPPGGAS